LGDVRVKELQHSVDILKVSKHELFQYPDGGIASISSEKLKQLIYELILKHQPGLLITYDEFIGLYGHPDHRLTAQYTREVVDEHRDEPNFPVQALYVVTAPRKMIEVAMSISEEVRQAFHGDAGSRLPVPDFAMRIRRYAKAKSQAMHAHLSQHGVLSQFFPYHDHFPTWLYFFVFDREYFAKVL
jgi:LmbE family N-acetylglucosaminyl deacetylase